MALSPDDFNQNLLTSVDFGEPEPTGANINSKTASMIAGGHAAMTGASPEEYMEFKQSIMDPATRQNFLMEQQQLRDAIWEDARAGLADVMLDESIDPAVRQSAVVNFNEMPAVNRFLSTSSNLAIQSLRADSGTNETAVAEDTRFSLLDSIERVNKEKLDRTKAINAVRQQYNQDGLTTTTNVIELMVPFAEWINIDRTLGAVKGETTVAALGNQKRELYNQMRDVPMDQRAEFTEWVIDQISNNDQVVLPDGNYLVVLETLENMLIDNDYSNFERWFDNVTSVLDVTGLVAGVGKLLRGGGAVADAVEGAEAVEKTGRAVVRASEEARAGDQEFGRQLARESEEFESTEDLGTLGEEAKEFKGEPDPVAEEVFRGGIADSVRSDVIPSSPSQVVKDTNPELARIAHTRAMDDETGEMAEAAYGASRTEAAGKDLLHEPDTKGGKMENKVEMKRPDNEVPPEIKKAMDADGRTYVSETEMATIRQRIVGAFDDVIGNVFHKASMIQRTLDNGSFQVVARYSPTDSGHIDPQAALDYFEYSFRDYGVTPENLKLLARNGSSWTETTLEEARAKQALKEAGATGPEFEDIDYAVGVDYTYNFRPEDLTIDEVLTTAPGLMARFAQLGDRIGLPHFFKGGGSLTQHLVDPSSVVHPRIVNPAFVAVDRSFSLKRLYEDSFTDFAKGYSKLKKDRKTLMSDYIKEANRDGISLDVTDLYTRGFNEREIELLKKWRIGNDIMWHAANTDMIKTLRGRGMKMYIDKSSDSVLIGSPLNKGSVKNDLIFDSVQNTFVALNKTELDELYEKGRSVFKLSEPMDYNGQRVDQVLVRNLPDSGFVRDIADSDTVLHYREGYYPVMYDANFFIRKVYTNARGEKSYQTVASARDTKETNLAKQALEAAEKDEAVTYEVVKNRVLEQDRSRMFDEGAWHTVSSSGLSSQKIRGRRLNDAGSDLHNFGHDHLKDPLEAVAQNVNSMSQRVAMRDYLETMKNRWVQSYGQYLDMPADMVGQKKGWPNSVDAIKGKPGVPEKIVADARTNFNYLYSLENGYINKVDDTWRGIVQFGAQKMADFGIPAAERALLSASTGSPTRSAKGLAFNLYIAANPLRQAVIQRGQLLQVAAINPTYFPTMIRDLVGIDLVRFGVSKNPKYVKMWNELVDSGIVDAVDAHSFLRDDMMRLTELTFAQKVKKPFSSTMHALQKVGFDPAEQDVLIGSYLAHRDMAIKSGKSEKWVKSARGRDELLGQTRAFTLGMNRAGEMAYSQNTLSMVAQFFSFRHKAMIQPITNRSLTKMQKAQVLGTNLAVFGIDATILYATADLIFGKEPSETKDVIRDGLLDMTLNKALTLASGEETAIDFGDLAPTEALGTWSVLTGLMSTDVGTMIANSPSSSLIFGNSPKLKDGFKTAMRFFNVIDDYDDPAIETKFSDVARAHMELFSGLSNAYKAGYAFANKQKMSSSGRITDDDVTAVEAVAQAFGFLTKDEKGRFQVQEALYGKGSFEDSDVDAWYKELKRHLARRRVSPTEEDMGMRILQEAWRVFGTDRPRAVEKLVDNLERDAESGDYLIFRGLTSRMGMIEPDDMWKAINQLPDGDQRDKVVQIMKHLEGTTNGD